MASKHESASDFLSVPEQFWDDLKAKDINQSCSRALARQQGPDQLVLSFLNRDILVDVKYKSIREMRHGCQSRPSQPDHTRKQEAKKDPAQERDLVIS